MRRRHRNLKPATAGPYRVRAVWRSDRGVYYAEWRHTATGETGRRSLKTDNVREADRLCSDVAAELAARRTAERTGWRALRRRYVAEHLAGLSASYRESFELAADHFERIVCPRDVFDADASAVSRYIAGLRDHHLAPASIGSYAAALKAFLRWAERLLEGVYAAPQIQTPSRRRGCLMRGRPITAEEFERMLAKAKKAVGAAHAAGWRHLMRGLYLSGLRRCEALALTWDRENTLHVYHGPEPRYRIDGRRPMLAILAEFEKGKKDRLLPITPDFATFLRKTPVNERTGHVFRPTLARGRPHEDTVSHRIRLMAELAGVAAGTNADGSPRWATPHDFRRSFGDRWAPHVEAMVLKELMRHESIETTERYYVGRSAERTAAAVYDAFQRIDQGRDAAPTRTGCGQDADR